MSEQVKESAKKRRVGDGTPGPGRPKGVPNKSTIEFRETVQKLLDANSENVQKWLAMVAEGHGDTKPDPAKALDLMGRLAEYAAPKLSRTEVTGSGGKDLIPPQFIIQPTTSRGES